MKKSVILLITLFAFITNACALETCTPTDDYLNYVNLSEEEKLQYIEPIYCKEMEDSNDDYRNFYRNFKNVLVDYIGEGLPSYYNAVNDNVINTVKNQYEDGTCWAFSALSVVETNAKKNNLPLYNLAEAHVVYSIIGGAYSDDAGKVGKYNSEINGGRITYAASYFFGDYGVLNESSLPYTMPSLVKITANDYVKGERLLSVDKFEINGIGSKGACTTSTIADIKNRVINNGSVQGTMYWNDNYLNNGIYYLATDGLGDNHGVTIVGWDDSISRTKFGASRDGAWIVKNSWGKTWGNQGYFYVSYDDIFICEQYASYTGVTAANYDHLYQASDVVGSTIIGFSNHIYVTTKVTKQSSDDEEIKKISFATPEFGNYTVYVASVNNLTNKSKWKNVGSGSSTTLGVASVTLDEIIESDVYVIVEYNASSTLFMLATSAQSTDTSLLTYERNKNFISVDTTTWFDLAEADHSAGEYEIEPILYVYTKDVNTNTSSITYANVSSIGERFELEYINPEGLNIKKVQIFYGENDVTDDFEITVGDTLVINNTNKKVGNYNVIIIDENDNTSSKTITIKSSLVLPQLYKLNSTDNTSDDLIVIVLLEVLSFSSIIITL
ncbi:MAG: C1 family peptidase [Bacilli bacterium]|nr:C1 family peptidase [Bacilli bacterium]